MPFLIDTDGGEDDILGIMLALNSGRDVRGITTVAGCFPLEYVSGNVSGLLRLSGKDLPVYRGSAQPLYRTLVTCEDLQPSMKGRFLPSHESRGDAKTAITDFIHDKDAEIICLGPLTNIAEVIREHGPVKNHLTIMGGGFNYRNWPPHLPRYERTGEYNMYVDPEAAKIVFAYARNITLVPADLAYDLRWEKHGFDIKRNDTVGVFLHELYQTHTSPLYDPLAVAVALNPAIACYEVTGVEVDCSGRRGNTTRTRGSNIRLCTYVDREAFFDIFNSLLNKRG